MRKEVFETIKVHLSEHNNFSYSELRQSLMWTKSPNHEYEFIFRPTAAKIGKIIEALEIIKSELQRLEYIRETEKEGKE